jgi:hypothetical protein
VLLDDIVTLATDDQQPITALLRKCIVLAHRLKNDRLKAWANEELNGYASVDTLPEYRILSAAATGTFVGPGWMQTTQGIPSGALKKQHQKFAETVYLSQPVSTLEDILKTARTTITFPWNANLVAHYQDQLMSGWQLFSAQQTVVKSVVAGIIDTVRTRVLNMALEIQSELGERDEDLKEITPEKSQIVEQTITNNILGGTVFLSTGQSTMTVTQQSINVGDWESLSKVLHGVGVSEPELAELSEAVQEDGDEKMGTKVKGWIARTAPKVLSGGVKIGTEIGKALLKEHLKHYFGLSE